MFFPVIGDPYYSSVVLLLPMTGVHGSTTFTDFSASNKTITRNNATISTAISKWGYGSGYFDGTGDFLSTPDSDDFNFASGDFCIEAWVYMIGTPTENKMIYDHRSDDGTSNFCIIFCYDYLTDTIAIYYTTNGTSQNTVTFTGSPSKNTWLHLALVRNGNTGYCYVNGTSSATTVDFTGVTLYNSTNAVKIGGRGDGLRSWNGYLQDVRVTKGVPRYTTNFTPPVGPLLPRELPINRNIVQQPSHHIISHLGL